MSKLVDVIVNEEAWIDMFDMCGIAELEIIISLLKKRINRMLQKNIDIIKMYENDKYLKNATGAINALYKSTDRIKKLLN